MSQNSQVRPITFDKLDDLGIDESDNLYWQGRKLRTQTAIKLDFWVNLSVIAAGVGTLGSFILSLVEFVCQMRTN